MRVIITSDIHNGYPGRIDDTVWSMQTMHDYAVSNGISKIIVLGDLFHNREYISINVLNKVFDFFENSSKNIEWIAFPGNHDMFMKTSWKINSIKPLSSYVNTVNNISTFVLDGRRFIVVPFMHYEHEYMDVIKYLETQYNEDDVLLTHIGVNNAVNNSCFLLKMWSTVSFVESKFNLIFAGHFHNHQIVDNKVCYPGSPIPFKFDEGMVPHGFVDFDTDNLFVNFVDMKDIAEDCPCDFVTIRDDQLQEFLSEGNNICNNNKVRIALQKEYAKDELDSIRNKIIDSGATSVSWMKPKSEEVQYDEDEKIIVEDGVFESWLKHVDASKYDVEKLKNMHKIIADEAEDLYVRSVEDYE